MKRTDAVNRLHRLDELSLRLSDGEVHSQAALGKQLNVSARTIARDIQLLRARGWAIGGSVGPGGGVNVTARWSADTTVLREQEAMQVLLGLAVSQALGLSGGLELAGVRSRLASSFAPADRTRIEQLRRRIRVATPVSNEARATQCTEQPGTRQILLQAFLTMQTLTFSYADAKGQYSQRQVEPQYLIYAWPFWYLIVWDLQRISVRTFRMDRIKDPRATGPSFYLKAPRPFWQACDDVGIKL